MLCYWHDLEAKNHKANYVHTSIVFASQTCAKDLPTSFDICPVLPWPVLSWLNYFHFFGLRELRTLWQFSSKHLFHNYFFDYINAACVYIPTGPEVRPQPYTFRVLGFYVV